VHEAGAESVVTSHAPLREQSKEDDVAASHSPTAGKRSGWVGWVYFTAVMLVMVGVFNVVNGLAAVFSAGIFVSGAEGSVAFDLTTWGWIHIALGAAVATAGFLLVQGSTWARVLAGFLVMLNMVSQLLFLPAYPFWSLLIIVVDVLVLWALTVHGHEGAAHRR
jgi:hypothetical protein